MAVPNDPSAHLELLDWRRRVAELFAELRRRPADEDTLAWFRGQKDDLFRNHAQSPLPAAQRRSFTGLAYWPYDPSARVSARYVADAADIDDVTATEAGVQPAAAQAPFSSADQELVFSRVGRLEFQLHGRPLSLSALWIGGYAGGLFVPFIDTTSGHETYGGGRYLLDTIKSADLGSDLADNTVVLDFNYAYHPSCAYDPRWACPLAPPDSRLMIPIRAGEYLR